MNMLLMPSVMCVVFFFASIRKMQQAQIENATTRFLVFIWYFIIFLHPDLVSLSTQQVVGRWLFMLLGAVEVCYHILGAIAAAWHKHQIRRRGWHA